MRTALNRPTFGLNEAGVRDLPREVPRFNDGAAFTLVEVLAGSAVLLIMGVSLYAGFTFGIQQIRLGRENIRATQILEEKMEMARLLNWNQVAKLPGYVPSTFEESYYSTSATNIAPGSLVYYGTVVVTNAPVTESYSNDLRMIRVTVRWTNFNLPHKRTMFTFVSQYGMQNYVY